MLPLYFRRILLLGAFTFFILPGAQAQQAAASSDFRGLPVRSHLTDPSIESRVEALLKRMTLEEKVGQLVQYSAGTPTGPGTGRGDYQDMIAKGQVGSLFNIESVKNANQLQKQAVEKSRLHIPLLFGLDVIHGIVPDAPQVTAQVNQILGEADLEEPDPSRLTVFWFYTHPPIGDRIAFALHYDPWSQGREPEFIH